MLTEPLASWGLDKKGKCSKCLSLYIPLNCNACPLYILLTCNVCSLYIPLTAFEPFYSTVVQVINQFTVYTKQVHSTDVQN